MPKTTIRLTTSLRIVKPTPVRDLLRARRLVRAGGHADAAVNHYRATHIGGGRDALNDHMVGRMRNMPRPVEPTAAPIRRRASTRRTLAPCLA